MKQGVGHYYGEAVWLHDEFLSWWWRFADWSEMKEESVQPKYTA